MSGPAGYWLARRDCSGLARGRLEQSQARVMLISIVKTVSMAHHPLSRGTRHWEIYLFPFQRGLQRRYFGGKIVL
jgi:hypothetical protein